MKRTRPHYCQQTGASYVELLVATIIVSLTAIPALDALSVAMQTTDAGTNMTAHHHRLTRTLETVLAESYATLAAEAAGPATPTSYSDIAGSPDRLVVFITPYDGDNADADDNPFTGSDAGILWVRAELENTRYGYQALIRDP